MNRGIFEGSFRRAQRQLAQLRRCSSCRKRESLTAPQRPETSALAGVDRLFLRGRCSTSMKIIPASDSSLLVVFGNVISLALHERVMALFHAFQARRDPRIRNLHPGYASLLIDFDPLRLTHDELNAMVQQLDGTGDFAAERRRQRGYHSSVLRRRVRTLIWPMWRSTRAFRSKRLSDCILRQPTSCISSDSLRVSSTSAGCRKSCTLPGWPPHGRPSPAAASGLRAVRRESIRLTLPEDGS